MPNDTIERAIHKDYDTKGDDSLDVANVYHKLEIREEQLELI